MQQEHLTDEEIDNIEPSEAPAKPRWAPQTPAEVDWALSKIQDQAAEIAALQFRKQCYIENLDAQIAEAQRKANGMEWAWRAAIEQVARAVKGTKQTVVFDHGKVVFRKMKATREIVDMDQAIAWAEEHQPEIVIVKKKVNQTDLPEGLESEVMWMRQKSEAGERMTLVVGPEKTEDAG